MSKHQLESVAGLSRRLDDPETRLIDCRFDLADPLSGQREFAEAHIPGAVFADLDKDLSSPITPASGRHPLPKVDKLLDFFGRCGIDERSEVVVYDSGNGAMAARCWWLLRWLGHTKVQLLDGGFGAWRQAGHPTVSGPSKARAGRFTGNVDPESVIETSELQAALPNIADFRLFDAREAARFLGQVEPIDSIAGHIPGAHNLPLSRSVEANGRWKSQEALEALWEEALGTDKDAAWSVMCGSGVTACHLALSAMQAGYRAPRLYAGSWSEWIRDEGRPVASVNR